MIHQRLQKLRAKKLETIRSTKKTYKKARHMQIQVNGEIKDIAPGASLANALALFSPYGDEATVVRVNGTPFKSVDAIDNVSLSNGDVLDIYPLVIGG